MPHRPVHFLPALVLAVGLVLAPSAGALAAPAHTAAKSYANCTAVHRVWSGGIAKPGVTKNRTPSGSRALKGKVLHDAAAYAANSKMDRDHDGVACEKS